MQKENKPLSSVELLKISAEYLASMGVDNARLDAEVLLADILGVDRIKLYVDYDRTLLNDELIAYRHAIAKRAKRMPLAYITGHKEFMSLNLFVKEGVLIPRPDTETLIEIVEEYITRRQLNEPEILDLCTGSGAVACALASIFPKASIKAVDISTVACEVAEKNAFNLGFKERIEILQGDLYKALKEERKFDVIVTNPPYIPSSALDELQPEVSNYEPRLALDGGTTGMDLIETIISESVRYLKPSGMLALEIGDAMQARATCELLKGINMVNVSTTKDLSGLDRVVSGEDGS